MLFLCEDEDLVKYEPTLDNKLSRKDTDGNVIVPSTWLSARQLSAEEIVRLLEASMAGNIGRDQRFDIAKVSQASKEKLRACAAHFAIYFIFDQTITSGGEDDFLNRRREHYWDRAQQLYQLATAPGVEYSPTANSLGTERKLPTSVEILFG